jgi:hypothetical protein
VLVRERRRRPRAWGTHEGIRYYVGGGRHAVEGDGTGHGDHDGGAAVEASMANLMASSFERPGGMSAEA